MNLAALDLGSNSFHILVARVSASGHLLKIASQKEVLKLGSVVESHKTLPPAEFQNALAAVGSMVALARAHRAERVVAVGTSALRDAANGPQFCRVAAAKFRLPVEVLSGRDEGELVYRGVRSAFPSLSGSMAVIDIGGGSVEIAVGDGPSCSYIASLPLGFLRVTQAIGDHPGRSRAAAIAERVREEAAEVARRLQQLRPQSWVFSGGTARAFGKFALSGTESIGAEEVARVTARLARETPARLRDLGVDEARADTLAAGAEVLHALVDRFQVSGLRVSPRGLREGVLLRELARTATGEYPAVASQGSFLTSWVA